MRLREALRLLLIGFAITAAVGVSSLAMVQVAQTKHRVARDRVRSDAEIARIARKVFPHETKAQRAARIARLGKEAIKVCAGDPECVALGRALFGPSHARLMAAARRAAREVCAHDACRGSTGARGRPGRNGARGHRGKTGKTGANGATGATGAKGDTGAAGRDGASAQDVLTELCVRLHRRCP
jgi:hypothetical protein